MSSPITIYREYHQNLPEQIRKWLNARGISDEIINRYFIGWDKDKITIPIFDENGNWLFFKYRKDPDDKNETKPKYWYSLKGMAVLYGVENLKGNPSQIIICEGELDRLVLESKGFKAICSTGGAETFKQEWLKYFKNIPKVYICYDNDQAGMEGAKKVAKLLPQAKVIMLPEMKNEKKDITDYFQIGFTINDFQRLLENAKTLDEIEKENEIKEMEIKKSAMYFSPLSIKELSEILNLTVKHDKENKIITFLCMLTAFTENSQFNISYNALTSTGKSFIPIELSQLFPKEDVIKVAYSSPTAFFHDKGTFKKEIKGYELVLERKILIFLDQPHALLLQHLRPLLSHDEKTICLKITDKNQKFGLRTKNIYIRGFPSVIFCTSSLKVDEQEATRLLLLSPETQEEKLKDIIHEKVVRESDSESYFDWLEKDTRRKLLKERVQAIKDMNIKHIIISNPEKVYNKFMSQTKHLKPKYVRDIGRLISIIKGLSLLNLWNRESRKRNIVANEEDIDEAFKLWNKILESQELGIPPYVYNIYKEVMLLIYKEGKKSMSREDVAQKYYEIYGCGLSDWRLRKEIIPMWESTGLIIQEPDPDDKRRILITPTRVPKEDKTKIYRNAGWGRENNRGKYIGVRGGVEI